MNTIFGCAYSQLMTMHKRRIVTNAGAIRANNPPGQASFVCRQIVYTTEILQDIIPETAA